MRVRDYEHLTAEGPQGDPALRNPYYADGPMWKEFLWDVWHFDKVLKRAWIGSWLGIAWFRERF